MSIVEIAQAIAEEAHAGQTDKAGRPYIGHPARVAARVDTEEQAAAAWLHDVEETPVTAEQLHSRGIPQNVVTAVQALTRSDEEEGDDYYRRVRCDPNAVADEPDAAARGF